MNMELQEQEELGVDSPESDAMSLDVKLAFNRVCSLIYSLKDDIGQEAASQQLLRIRNDVDRILSRKRNRGLLKENGLHHFSELNVTGSTVKPKETHNFSSQYNAPTRQGCLPPCNGNVSYFSAKNETVNGPSFANLLEGNQESASKYHQENGVTSFFSSKNDLCISSSSSFRPMVKNTSDVDNFIKLGPIVEESRFEINGLNSSSEEEDEDPVFILKSWTVLIKEHNFFLKGIKLNQKGEVLEKNFVSEKVVSRPQNDKVKTSDGVFILKGPLTDEKKVIPSEVRNQYFENEGFPRNWRSALKLWSELEQTKKKEGKAKKRISPQKKTKDAKSRKKSISPKKKMKDEGARKRSISPKKKMKDEGKEGARKRSISPKKKMKDEGSRKRSVSPKKKMKSKKTDDGTKNNPKKPKSSLKSQHSDNHDLERNGTNKKSENEGQDGHHGPFTELLGDESLFTLPTSSLTPNGLLNSIKKNVIKGRYTPPTSMFDNVYGSKSDNNSSVNTSFDDIGVKNNHVVKRMCKVSKKTNPRQNNKSPKHMVEEDEAINEILRVAKAKANTTPSIMKQVFSAERVDDSVNFSDLSDVEVI